MAEVAAILLAAGLSRRMGTQNKLLLPIDDVPMVRRVVEVYLTVLDTPLTVVTGYDADLIRAALHGLDVAPVHNANFADGQPGSVAAGLQAAPDAKQLLIGLGDQPALTTQDLVDLLDAQALGDPQKIAVPVYDGQRGNPIVVPRGVRPRLTQDRERPGCMRFTRDHPEHVQAIPLRSAGFYTDVDTPADYAALRPPALVRTL